MRSLSTIINFSGLSLSILLLTAILHIWDASVFVQYLGQLDPILGVLLVISVGISLVRYLEKSEQKLMLNSFEWEGLLTSSLFSACFGVIIILIDFTGIFPDNINVGYPICLIFYPVMAYIVEILFHLLPISLLSKFNLDDTRAYYLIALIEPAFQLVIGGVDSTIFWASMIVSFHIFLINVAQLYVFKKYGFLTMYWLRFGYYLIWHEIWGVLRLGILF